MMRSKKIKFFALVLVAIMAFTTVAMAVYVYESRYGHNTLVRGHTGQYVSNLQADINQTGAGNCGAVDGTFGSDTERGVRQYQGARGLSVDGQAGHNTKTRLWNETTYGRFMK